ncbi:MAG: hypothetical protein JXB00_04150 [Bacteroidales bacterium]|nr:hypothetical protein [Bacteroidales bacterium]
MKKSYLFITSILIIIIANACPDNDDPGPDATLKIINNTFDSLLFYFVFRSENDTSIPLTNVFPDENAMELNLILPDSIKEEKGAFIAVLEQAEDKVLMLFLFNKSTVEEVPWSTIREEYLVLRRYDLTKEELVAMDWTITYP